LLFFLNKTELMVLNTSEMVKHVTPLPNVKWSYLLVPSIPPKFLCCPE